MDKLSDRVMALEVPDREIEAEIWLALHKPDWRSQKHWKQTNGWAAEERPSSMVSFYTPDGLGCSETAPRYLQSLDAAMSLVDPRALYAFGNMEDGPFARLCWPQPDGSYSGGYVEAAAETPALALCAAALKARGL